MENKDKIFDLYQIYKNDINIFNKAISYINSFDKNDVFDIIFINEISLNLFKIDIAAFKKLLNIYSSKFTTTDEEIEKYKLDEELFHKFYLELIIFFNKVYNIPEVGDFPLIYSKNQISNFDSLNLIGTDGLPNVSLMRFITHDKKKIFLSFTETELKNFRKSIDDAISSMDKSKG